MSIYCASWQSFFFFKKYFLHSYLNLITSLFHKKNEKNNDKKLSIYKILFKQKDLGANLDFPGACPNT